MPRLGDKIFGAKPPKFGAEGAVLENFGQILEKLWLKHAIKVNFLNFQKNFCITLVSRLQNGFLEGTKKNFPLKH